MIKEEIDLENKNTHNKNILEQKFKKKIILMKSVPLELL